jgi:hypothetical protein
VAQDAGDQLHLHRGAPPIRQASLCLQVLITPLICIQYTIRFLEQYLLQREFVFHSDLASQVPEIKPVYLS